MKIQFVYARLMQIRAFVSQRILRAGLFVCI